jgi:hypothetical protein
MASINYLIQFVVVRPSILQGEAEGLGLFVMGNPHAIFTALATSYAYQSLGMLFAAWALGGGKLERWIRWLFVAVGVTVPFQLGYSLGFVPMMLGLPVLMVWIVGVPLSCFLLAARFRRAERRTA